MSDFLPACQVCCKLLAFTGGKDMFFQKTTKETVLGKVGMLPAVWNHKGSEKVILAFYPITIIW